MAEGIESLPEEFRKLVDNVEVVLKERPGREHRERVGRGGESWRLLGLYEGVPYGRRGTDYGGVMPDKITLFRAEIEAYCGGDRARMVREIRRVFLHELGHYFGFSDKRLRELGY